MPSLSYRISAQIIVCLLFLFFAAYELGAQPLLKSSVKGCVLDAQSMEPLTGANILVQGSNPPLACSSDETGHFRLKEIPIGSAELRVSYIGYITFVSDPIVISS